MKLFTDHKPTFFFLMTVLLAISPGVACSADSPEEKQSRKAFHLLKCEEQMQFAAKVEEGFLYDYEINGFRLKEAFYSDKYRNKHRLRLLDANGNPHPKSEPKENPATIQHRNRAIVGKIVQVARGINSLHGKVPVLECFYQVRKERPAMSEKFATAVIPIPYNRCEFATTESILSSSLPTESSDKCHIPSLEEHDLNAFLKAEYIRVSRLTDSMYTKEEVEAAARKQFYCELQCFS